MRELLATNDMVLISYVETLLRQAGIDFLILDQNMSILEGSIGIIPRRVMVEERKLHSARALLEDAGMGRELSTTRKQ